MSEFTADKKAMLKTILAKRQTCVQLTDAEDKFAREMFDALVGSKQTMHKVVKFVTGADLRKSKVDAPAARPGGEHKSKVDSIEDDKPAAKPDTSARGAEKLPDADEKPKAKPTEDERLESILQLGDLVSKTVDGRTLKGTIMGMSVDGATAIVKFEDGRQTYEATTTLKSARIPEAKEAPADGKEPVTEIPVKKDGDIVGHPVMLEPAQAIPSYSENKTPFEGLVCALQRILDLGRALKEYRETAGDDEEVVAYYDEVLEDVREMAESILAALSMELGEAKVEAEPE